MTDKERDGGEQPTHFGFSLSHHSCSHIDFSGLQKERDLGEFLLLVTAHAKNRFFKKEERELLLS